MGGLNSERHMYLEHLALVGLSFTMLIMDNIKTCYNIYLLLFKAVQPSKPV